MFKMYKQIKKLQKEMRKLRKETLKEMGIKERDLKNNEDLQNKFYNLMQEKYYRKLAA